MELKRAFLGSDGAKADVAAHLAALEVNPFGDFVSFPLRNPHGIPKGSHAQYASAVGHYLAVFQHSAGMEDVKIVPIARQACNLVARAWMLRITSRRHDSTERHTPVPFRLYRPSCSIDGMLKHC